MESMPRTKFQDFIDNQLFFDWVNHPTRESDRYWKEYILQHPSEKEQFEEAKFIISKLKADKYKPKELDAVNVWNKIQAEIRRSSPKIKYLNHWMVAASLILILTVGAGIFLRITMTKNSVDYASILMDDPTGGDVKLILSNNAEKQILSREPDISYSKEGKLLVDSKSVSTEVPAADQSDKVELNQLIVPKGKRSVLTLSDGTRLFLNSGSQVIYPVLFDKKKREIFIRGEAYLEVAHNESCPFVVKTDHLDVQVLGTEFNIQSYPDESSSTVVLVKGSVQAITESGKVKMAENEVLTLDNSTESASLTQANVLEYISWKDGWMYCSNEKMESIAKKITRYYAVNIEFDESSVKEITINGKLDLKTDWEEVLDVISFISPIDYKVVGENIILSTKK